MLTFSNYLTLLEIVRIDHFTDGDNSLPFKYSAKKEYSHNQDWSDSGVYRPGDEDNGYEKSKALFAGTHHDTAPYALPRTSKFITHSSTNSEKHDTLVIDKDTYNSAKSYKGGVLTRLQSRGFKRLPTKEYASLDDKKVNVRGQENIADPIRHIEKHGWKIKTVDNIDDYRKHLDDKNINYNGENL